MYDTPFHSDDLSASTFLVTGGAGFIGSNLVEYLLKYKAGKVVVLDDLSTGFEKNISPYLSRKDFQFVKGSICSLDECRAACEGVDYVFHEAALGSVPRSIQNPLATHNVNATGFINMLVAARDARVKRIVYASSSSVYGDSRILPKVEDQIGKQLSPYAVSKLTNELYGEIFAKTYSMEIVGLRYFNIFGPRQDPGGAYAAAIPLFIDALLRGEAPCINGDGKQTRDFTFVENAVQANIKAMLSHHINASGEIYNIAVGERVSLNQLMSILKKVTGADVQQTYREERPGDVRDSLADISRAMNSFNYSPAIHIEKGLELTLDWFKTQTSSNNDLSIWDS